MASPSSIGTLPDDWRAALREAASSDRLAALEAFVAAERATGPVYPPAQLVFEALRRTPLATVRAVILGL